MQRLRRGQADILDGHAHDAAREIERIFAAGKHAAQPIKRGVGIGVAHALVQRGDQVVVLLAGFVVHQHALLRGFRRDGFVMCLLPSAIASCAATSSVLYALRTVAAGIAGDQFQRVIVGSQLQRAQAALFVGQRPPQQAHNLLVLERLAARRRGSARAAPK